ncbi:MAG: mechanosensitive ion channel [Nitrospirota bacterium]|nr:MAG: mechanosensitive ion channel [Nitrospirota bacterium]
MTFESVYQFFAKFFAVTLVTVKDTPITPVSIIIFLLIFISFLFLASLISTLLRRRVFPRFHLEEGMQYNLARAIRYLIGITGAVVAFQFIGIDLSGLAVIFGLLSVGIGFGLQNVTSNFVAGIILLFERPIAVGDRITVGETEGDVMEINMRATMIRSIDNITIIVPNSEFISGRVTNWSHGDKKVRLNIDVGVSYTSDLETVLRCLNEVAAENEKVLKNPRPVVHFMGFGDSSWNMRLRCWIADPKVHWQVKSDINCAIVMKFRENGVEIPYPQRDLHMRSPIPLPLREENG